MYCFGDPGGGESALLANVESWGAGHGEHGEHAPSRRVLTTIVREAHFFLPDYFYPPSAPFFTKGSLLHIWILEQNIS